MSNIITLDDGEITTTGTTSIEPHFSTCTLNNSDLSKRLKELLLTTIRTTDILEISDTQFVDNIQHLINQVESIYAHNENLIPLLSDITKKWTDYIYIDLGTEMYSIRQIFEKLFAENDILTSGRLLKVPTDGIQGLQVKLEMYSQNFHTSQKIRFYFHRVGHIVTMTLLEGYKWETLKASSNIIEYGGRNIMVFVNTIRKGNIYSINFRDSGIDAFLPSQTVMCPITILNTSRKNLGDRGSTKGVCQLYIDRDLEGSLIDARIILDTELMDGFDAPLNKQHINKIEKFTMSYMI